VEGLRYRLALDLADGSLDYTGRLELSARALPSPLTLDTVGHTIRAVTSVGRPVEFRFEPDDGRLVVPTVPPGTTAIEIEYAGRVDDHGVRGFYASPLGEGRAFSTYFEPASARRLLPCIDRPDAKAEFILEVTGPGACLAISNTEVERTETLPDGRRRTRFRPTPPMSTYLFYLALGPFEERAGTGAAPRVIVATAPGRSAAGAFSLEQAERSVAYFSEYYAVPYPLPKLHLLAIPQFGTGAMENWGAIAFQEYLLLHDDRSSVSARMRSVEVICHEVAHQWFGDLVTMRWWNDLWLNESFASYVAIQASAALFPQWSPWDDYLASRYAGAMLWDALPHTHPIRVEVSDPNQIRQIFDEISYGKGSSVLRMAEAYVGEASFRAGVSRYLAEHRFGNAESDDLWRAVGAAAHAPVESVFRRWVSRPGFPVVRVRQDGGTLRLEQERFTMLDPVADDPWPIPLEVRSGTTTHRRLFDTPRLDLPDGGPTPVVNPGRSGFYRVQYEGALRERILAAFGELPPIDRWGIANDARALFLAGRTDLSAYLEVFARLEREDDPFVASEVVDTYRTLHPLIHRIPRWNAAVRSAVVAQSDRLGLDPRDGESDRDASLREAVTVARAQLDPAFAARLAEEYPRLDTLSPNLTRAVLVAYAIRAGAAEYSELKRRLDGAKTPDELRNVAFALGMIRREEWLRADLDLLLSGKMLLGPWLELYAGSVLGNPDASGAAWGFLRDRVDEFLRLTAGTGIQSAAMQFSVPYLGLPRPAEMRAWAARHTFPDSARAVEKGLDLLELYLRVVARSK